MATLRVKSKLAPVNRESQEEHPRNNLLRDTNTHENNDEYITQISEEVQSRVTKKISKELSKGKRQKLGALSKLNEFFLRSQVRIQSGSVEGNFTGH